jgi:hypothetical protein
LSFFELRRGVVLNLNLNLNLNLARNLNPFPKSPPSRSSYRLGSSVRKKTALAAESRTWTAKLAKPDLAQIMTPGSLVACVGRPFALFPARMIKREQRAV